MNAYSRVLLLAIVITCSVWDAPPLRAQNAGGSIWKNCQSSDTETRLVACTAVISAGGFGSASRLAEALDARCWAYNTKMQFDRALSDCKAAIALRPKYFYAYNNLGVAYLGVKDYDRALAVLNKAIELRSNFSWSHINRAKAYVELGKIDDAAKDYEAAVILDPTNQETRHTLDTLRTRGTSGMEPAPAQSATASLGPAIGLQKTVAMQKDGGTYVVPVLINGVITLKFVVDSGAADVSIPYDVVSTLLRTGTIDNTDFIGRKTYTLADGTEVPSLVIRLRSLKVGDTLVENVIAGIADAKGSLLLGQSFLGRFKSWSINNSAHALLLNE